MAQEIKHGMMTDGHLGGYVVGGDPATFYPGLFDWLVETWKIGSVIDVGCGEGHALKYFADKGCTVVGIEGIPQDNPDIIQHDYTDGPLYPDDADLVWCVEVLEHIEEKYVPNVLKTFSCGKYVMVTHGEPGQPGWHHVNNQTSDYWKGAMAAVGYEFDEVLTAQARGFASMNTDPYNHFRRSGLAFRRRAQ